jgi:hypothetical protein
MNANGGAMEVSLIASGPLAFSCEAPAPVCAMGCPMPTAGPGPFRQYLQTTIICST